MLGDAELLDRIDRGESDCVEFTVSTTDLKKFRQAICAFANDLPRHGKPGLLLIGVKDDGSCAGSTINDGLLTTLGGLRDDGKIMPFPQIEVAKRRIRDCDVAVVQVEPSNNPPIKVDGRCWIRIGPRKGQATADEERRLTEKRRWGSIPFDMQGVIGATVESDLDVRAFENDYLPCAVSPEVLAENQRDRGEQLRALRLVDRDGRPTVTAILVLGRDPRYWFRGAYIQFVRFSGIDVTDGIAGQAELSGPLPGQLLAARSLLEANITHALDTAAVQHIEQSSYPLTALRELAHNAVIHRNYENSNTPGRIHWFADRVEILSPGSTFGEVGPDNIGQGVTSYRNPTIAEAMKNMGFMERFGIGITAARRALADNGNPPPEFVVKESHVLTTVRRRA